MRYKFRAKYSESDEYTIYRYYHYTPRQLGLRGFLATACAAIALFLLIPLPDELFVIPPMAAAFQTFLHVEFHMATIYAYATYKAIGLIFLGLTLLFGVQYLRDALFAKIKHVKDAHKKMQHYAEEGHKTIKNAHKRVQYYTEAGHKNIKRRLARKR